MSEYLINLLGERIRLPAAVTSFRGSMAVKRPLLESLFNVVGTARAHTNELEPAVAAHLDTEERARSLFDDPEKKRMVWEAAAERALMTDSAAALILIVAAEYDRLFRAANMPILARGSASYIPNITVAEAIHNLANQYKHLASWRVDAKKGVKERPVVEALLDDPLREDAAAEFLHRGFTNYDELDAAIFSCVDGLVTDGTIVATGRVGIPIITMHPKEPGT